MDVRVTTDLGDYKESQLCSSHHKRKMDDASFPRIFFSSRLEEAMAVAQPRACSKFGAMKKIKGKFSGQSGMGCEAVDGNMDESGFSYFKRIVPALICSLICWKSSSKYPELKFKARQLSSHACHNLDFSLTVYLRVLTDYLESGFPVLPICRE